MVDIHPRSIICTLIYQPWRKFKGEGTHHCLRPVPVNPFSSRLHPYRVASSSGGWVLLAASLTLAPVKPRCHKNCPFEVNYQFQILKSSGPRHKWMFWTKHAWQLSVWLEDFRVAASIDLHCLCPALSLNLGFDFGFAWDSMIGEVDLEGMWAA